MKICVFAYNFKHKKTQEGLLKLYLSKIKIDQVIAMNKVKINQPIRRIELTPKDQSFIEPKIICKNLNILIQNFYFFRENLLVFQVYHYSTYHHNQDSKCISRV